MSRIIVVGAEQRLGVRVEGYAGRGESLEVHDRRHHAFARQSVERPHQEDVELPPMGSIEHRGEVRTLVGALGAAQWSTNSATIR